MPVMTSAGWITAGIVFLAFVAASGRRPPWRRIPWTPPSPLRRILFCSYGAIAGLLAGFVVSKWLAYFAALDAIE
jgi:hypothetical protein